MEIFLITYSLAWETSLYELFAPGQVLPINPVAVADGTVVATMQPAEISLGTGGVAAFNADNGSVLWQHKFVDKHSINPPAIAYGAQGAGDSIGPNEVLYFKIELVGIADG